MQYGFFYPLRYPLVILAGATHWDIYHYQLELAFHYWLASVFMFTLLMVLLKNPTIAFIGGVLFAYNGYMSGYPMLQGNILQTITWLPLVLLGIEISLRQKSWHRWGLGGSVLSAFSVGMMLLAGHPQIALYCLYFTIVYSIFRAWQSHQTVLAWGWRVSMIFGLGGMLAMAQLLPMLELTRNSFRLGNLNFNDKAGGFSLTGLLNLFWNNTPEFWSPLYIGVVTTILAGATLFRKKGVSEIFWIMVALVILLLSLGINTIAFDVVYITLPGMSLFRNHERIIFLAHLAIIFLAVIQLKKFTERKNDETEYRHFRWVIMGYGICLITIVIVLSLLHQSALPSANQISFTLLIWGLLIIWYHLPQHSSKMMILAILIILDLFTVGMRSRVNFVADIPQNHTQLSDILRPYQNADNTWRIDGSGGLQGRSMAFRIPDIYGVSPIALDSAENILKIPVDRFWEVLAVRYVTTTDTPPQHVPMTAIGMGQNYGDTNFTLYELLNPRPMAHLVYDYRHAHGDMVFARQIMSDSQVNLREMGVTQHPLAITLPTERPEISIIHQFEFVSPEEIIITASTQTNALLTIALVNYPGWRATVNGEDTPIVDNYAGLMGVPLQAGTELVIRLTYHSNMLIVGILLSLISLIGILGCVGVAVWGTYPNPQHISDAEVDTHL